MLISLTTFSKILFHYDYISKLNIVQVSEANEFTGYPFGTFERFKIEVFFGLIFEKQIKANNEPRFIGAG